MLARLIWPEAPTNKLHRSTTLGSLRNVAKDYQCGVLRETYGPESAMHFESSVFYLLLYIYTIVWRALNA